MVTSASSENHGNGGLLGFVQSEIEKLLVQNETEEFYGVFFWANLFVQFTIKWNECRVTLFLKITIEIAPTLPPDNPDPKPGVIRIFLAFRMEIGIFVGAVQVGGLYAFVSGPGKSGFGSGDLLLTMSTKAVDTISSAHILSSIVH